jgi:glycosyltransferase involved in cell wall biosynthesis
LFAKRSVDFGGSQERSLLERARMSVAGRRASIAAAESYAVNEMAGPALAPPVGSAKSRERARGRGARGHAAKNEALRVAFVGQSGAAAGGAERTLATYLPFAPRDLVPVAILFEDGAFADELRGLSIPVEIVPAPDSLSKSSRERLRLGAFFDTFGHVARLARRLRELRIDVVFSNTMKAHFVCAPAARLAGIPCVMHFHDIVDGPLRHALRAVARFGSVERLACARIVAQSLALRHMTVSYGPIVLEAYQTLPNRHEARIRLGLPTDVPVVALVGRINRWKGHDRFLRIAAEINRRARVHFVMVGAPIFRDADFVPELEELVRRLGIEHAVSFIPWVDDVRLVYAAIDVNVNCSTREPFGRSVVEAAGAGVPSVCFDDSGAAETISDGRTGRIVPAGDETSFAGAILEFLPGVRHTETNELVKRSAMRFDATAIGEEIADVIRRAARSGAIK